MTDTAAPEDTRDRLLTAARTVIGRSSLHAARMEDIAAEAGVSRAAVYYHFHTKHDLAVALADDVFRRLTVTVRTALADGPIEGVLRAATRFFAGQLTLARLLIAEMPTPIDSANIMARHRDELLALIRERLRADMTEGRIRRCDPEVAATAVAALMRAAAMRLMTGATVDPDHLTDELCAFVRNALAPGGRSDASLHTES